MSTVASSSDSEKSKFSLRSSFRKPKHKGGDKDDAEDVGLAELLVIPPGTLVPIYCYRDDNDKLIRSREYGRVKFSEKPVEIGIAAPRTFSRNYTRSKNKRKIAKHQEGHQLMKLFQSPEVLERLDTVTNEELHELIASPPPTAIMSPDSIDSGIGVISPEIPALEHPKPKKIKQPLLSDPNLVEIEGPTMPLVSNQEPPKAEQIKLSFFKPPIAGSWIPPAVKKKEDLPRELDRSDGESSEADDEDDNSEENVYFVDQVERDEEALNILSNLDNGDDGFFNDDIILKETNIDEVIKKEIRETCIDSAPTLLNSNISDLVKETSLCEAPPVDEILTGISSTKEDPAARDHESEGSVDSGIHEAGTDSPSDEASPSENCNNDNAVAVVYMPKNSGEPESDEDEKVSLILSPPASPGGNELCYFQYNEEPSFARPRSINFDPHEDTSSEDSEVPDIPERPPSPLTVPIVNSPQISPRIPQKFLSPAVSPKRTPSPRESPSSHLQKPSPRNSPLSSPKPRYQPLSLPRPPAKITDVFSGNDYIPIDTTFHVVAEEDEVVIPRTSLSAVNEKTPPLPPKSPVSDEPIPELVAVKAEDKVVPRSGFFTGSIPTLAAKRALENKEVTPIVPAPSRTPPPEPDMPALPTKQISHPAQSQPVVLPSSPVEAQRTPPIQPKQAKIIQQASPTFKPKQYSPPIARRPIQPSSPTTSPIIFRRPHKISTPPPKESITPERFPTPPPSFTPPAQPKGGQMIYPDRTTPQDWKPPQPHLPKFPIAQVKSPGMTDFDDIDNLLMDLLENDPLIKRQELIRQNEIEQQKSAIEEQKRREEYERAAIEAAIQHARHQEQAQIEAAKRIEEEKEKKIQDELEAKREAKRKMREMSLDDILKKANNMAKRSPTLSIRSETSGSIRRASSESLNKEKETLGSTSSAQSMIAPLFMLDELLDPPMMFAQPIASSASTKNSSAEAFITSTISRNGQNTQQQAPPPKPPRVSPKTILRGVPERIPEAVKRRVDDDVFDLIETDSKTDTISPNSAVSHAQYLDLICNTGEATLKNRTLGRKNNAKPAAATPLLPKAASPIPRDPMEDWGDLDDLLKDVEFMATNLSEKIKLNKSNSNQSLNSIGSNSPKTRISNNSQPSELKTITSPPLPPRPPTSLPSRQNTKVIVQIHSQIPEHSSSSSAFSPPRSSRTFSPSNTFSPSRHSDTSSTNSQCSDSYVYNAAKAARSSDRQSPVSVSDFRFQRSNTLPPNYRKTSAFQEPLSSNDHRSFRRKNSIDDLQKRTEELNMQKRQYFANQQQHRGPPQPHYQEREIVQWDQMARAQAPSLQPLSPPSRPYHPPQQYHPSVYPSHHRNESSRSHRDNYDPRTSQRHEPACGQYSEPARGWYNEPAHGQYNEPAHGQYHDPAHGQYHEPARGQYKAPRGWVDENGSDDDRRITSTGHHTMV